MIKLADTLAGGYLSTAESKIALLLVSGSWVGWLMHELTHMLPARFRHKYLKNMPENEAAEVVFKYSRFFEVPVTGETAFSLVGITVGKRRRKTGRSSIPKYFTWKVWEFIYFWGQGFPWVEKLNFYPMVSGSSWVKRRMQDTLSFPSYITAL